MCLSNLTKNAKTKGHSVEGIPPPRYIEIDIRHSVVAGAQQVRACKCDRLYQYSRSRAQWPSKSNDSGDVARALAGIHNMFRIISKILSTLL